MAPVSNNNDTVENISDRCFCFFGKNKKKCNRVATYRATDGSAYCTWHCSTLQVQVPKKKAKCVARKLDSDCASLMDMFVGNKQNVEELFVKLPKNGQLPRALSGTGEKVDQSDTRSDILGLIFVCSYRILNVPTLKSKYLVVQYKKLDEELQNVVLDKLNIVDIGINAKGRLVGLREQMRSMIESVSLHTKCRPVTLDEMFD